MKLSSEQQVLVDQAKGVMNHSYSPYSKFRVASAVRTSDGRVFTGVNIENASFGGTVCAERIAVFKAISEGAKKIISISVITETDEPCSPCGFCRQVLVEFCDPACEVICATHRGTFKVYTLGELTPDFFKRDRLPQR